jgi:DNA (cytosine-5)-methyltransferase 1
MNHGSLFSGIGGFDLASEWAGWQNKFHCEWNEFGQKVIKYYWPEAESYSDITKTDFTIWRGKIDILTGGFPCQPYSMAGKRLGKEDDRHLWPEMLRAIREIQPRYVVGENVSGLVNWNGGMVFDEVQAEMEAEGYEVRPFILPAAGIGAPHQRERVWFIAYDSEHSSNKSKKYMGKSNYARNDEFKQKEVFPKSYNKSVRQYNLQQNTFTSDTTSDGRIENNRKGKSGFNDKNSKGNYWKNFPTQSPICDGDDGLSSRLDGITFPKWRNESIKAGGNAIVPQVAYQIFKSINEFEKQHDH